MLSLKALLATPLMQRLLKALLTVHNKGFRTAQIDSSTMWRQLLAVDEKTQVSI